MRHSNYDLAPFVAVPGGDGACVEGWPAIAERLRKAIGSRGAAKTVVVVECYIGVDEDRVFGELNGRLQPALCLRSAEALLPSIEIAALVAPYLGGEDPVFGRLAELQLGQFFDRDAIESQRRRTDKIASGLVLIVGCGARLVADGDLLVYADLSRWEAQQRQRRKEIANLGTKEFDLAPPLKYKRSYFIDWRICDRWKAPLIRQWDFVLDTTRPHEPKLAEGEAVRRGLGETARRPFRVVPFFDPAPWGGQWLREKFDLDPRPRNYGWGFDCVPEENSLLLGFASMRFELPAINLVIGEPQALLGESVIRRFGAEFPIRFDLLDTMGGGNLSFQVHPLREYAEKEFGTSYTQDESYYLLDAGPASGVYLGLKEGVDPPSMIDALKAAQNGGMPFPVERFVNRWLAKKHDHFLIPAGTVHCSAANSVVLEISATPYIFTFKLWDWNRPGLDGMPRPVHIDRGAANIQWDRKTEWTRSNLINRVVAIAEGPGWHEERTGLHEFQFIETRRHWFTRAVPHDTNGTVNVLNLVEGQEAVVESPDGAFVPFAVHYAETFIVPASVGPYTIRPVCPSDGSASATIKAYVRSSGSNNPDATRRL